MKPIALPSTDRAARLRILLTYLWRHGRVPDLEYPTRFTELVQRRKLLDRDPRMAPMADKVAVKAIVADRLGPEWVIPMLWSGEAFPQGRAWNQRVMVKARHGCRQNLILDPGDAARAVAAARLTRRWMRKPYGQWLDEWLYTQIPRGLLIEPFVGAGSALPVDYKVYVFGGQATHIQTHLDRGSRHRWFVHDAGWRALSASAPAITRPSALGAMLAAAEELARDFAFARVDFYQPGAQPLFGEVTFYPGSGLDPFDPPSLDEEMGALWLDAEACARGGPADFAAGAGLAA